MLQLGCHLSSSKGFLHMGKEAVSIGANTFQFFTRNPRGSKAKEIDPKDVQAYLDFAAEHQIGRIVAHAPYTLNACSADEKVREFARMTFADDLKRMEYLPGNVYNFHPGSHVGQGTDVGISYICDALKKALEPDYPVTVLLETMAGKGSEIGGKFVELRKIIDEVGSDKVGVCIDSCHIFDGGYDIVNDLDGVLREFDEIIGIDRLKAIHLNDSKNVFGSHKDRHACIGEGNLGMDTFRRIVNHPLLKDKPMILETPNELPGYQQEIALLRSLENE